MMNLFIFIRVNRNTLLYSIHVNSISAGERIPSSSTIISAVIISKMHTQGKNMKIFLHIALVLVGGILA